jgi:hypothetical protein
VNSYVSYLRSQGYFAEGSYPGDDWFYNRSNVNEYLGFNRYWFYQNFFRQYGEPGEIGTTALFREIINQFEEHVDNTKEPYFSFSVTYQHPAPPGSAAPVKEYAARGGLSESGWIILNNYLGEVAETVQAAADAADYFEQRLEPVLFIVFGSDMPRLGNGSEVYGEFGVSFDGLDGMEAYYSVPYLVYANPAAKEVLGGKFSGEGPLISPCFLFGAVFELGGMGGDGYMLAANELMKYAPVVAESGYALIDGQWSSRKDNRIAEFRRLQYYRRRDLGETDE